LGTAAHIVQVFIAHNLTRLTMQRKTSFLKLKM
jgi:hypothetical protein